MNEKLIALLNRALSKEYSAIIMYLIYSAKLKGISRPEYYDFFMEEVPDETKHAEILANKIVYYGGDPVVFPDTVSVANDLVTMIRNIFNAETEAVQTYKNLVSFCESINDEPMKLKAEELVLDEQTHLEKVTLILQKINPTIEESLSNNYLNTF